MPTIQITQFPTTFTFAVLLPYIAHPPTMLDKIFVQEAPIAIAMFDNSMRYIAVSQKWMIDYNLIGQHIIGKSHYEIFPEIGEDWKRIHLECLAGAVNKNSEACFMRADGTEQWLEWEVRPWYSTHNHRTIGGIVMYTADITERHRMKQRLMLSEEQFRSAFEYSPNGMALITLDAHWVSVNTALLNILGYSEAELLHMTTREMTHPDDLEGDSALATELLAGARTHYQREKRYKHRNGHYIWVLVSASLVRDIKGEPVYATAQITDITESKKREEDIQELLRISRDQNERLQNFAHIVSHNLRSHSGNISVLLDLFLQDYPEMNDNELIQSQMIAANNLLETINNLKEIVDINSIGHTPKSLNLRNYVSSAIQSVTALADEAGVTIENTVDETLYVQGVEAYLDSIILNFLTNGIKYRDATKEQRYVRLATSLTPTHIILSVTDNGIGMDMKLVRQKLFGMYKTFHGNSDARGIGLYITKNQVEAIGGKIEADSMPQLGTTFNIYFRQATSGAMIDAE